MTSPHPPTHRVVVTGLGAVTPVGLDAPSTWDAFVAGRSGVAPIALFDAAGMGFEAKVAAEVKGFVPENYMDRKVARRSDRVMQFAIAAAREALADAGLLDADGRIDAAAYDPNRAGCYMGSGVGGVGTLVDSENVRLEKGQNRISPLAVPMILNDSTPGAVSIQHGLKGPNMSMVSACASAANAIGEALELIRRGAADMMVAGGSEAAILPVVVAGFQNMGALSKWAGDPPLASRPFDAARDGFVIGEGAAVLILERLDIAQARGARIYAELAGYGLSADAGHITAPSEDGDGLIRAVTMAFDSAGVTPADIDVVSAHGTSTPINDKVETVALKSLFGERAYAVPVSAVKSMIGHLLGASGAVAALASCRTIQTGIVTPTINLHTPDPACDLDYVPNAARTIPGGVNSVLLNSAGFGGHNAALVFRKVL